MWQIKLKSWSMRLLIILEGRGNILFAVEAMLLTGGKNVSQ